MVAHPRKALRPDPFRALNAPRRLEVACNRRGEPLWIRLNGRRRAVDAVKDRWRLDDEWWRRPISRLYFLVELEGGTLCTLFCDLTTGLWYQQREMVGDGCVR